MNPELFSSLKTLQSPIGVVLGMRRGAWGQGPGDVHRGGQGPGDVHRGRGTCTGAGGRAQGPGDTCRCQARVGRLLGLGTRPPPLPALRAHLVTKGQ